MIDVKSRGPTLERRPKLRRQRHLCEARGVDQHVNCLAFGDDGVVSGNAELGRKRKRRCSQMLCPDVNLDDLVKSSRALPLDDLLDQLLVEGPFHERFAKTQRPQELEDGDVDVKAVTTVKSDLLWIAFGEPDAESIRKRASHR